MANVSIQSGYGSSLAINTTGTVPVTPLPIGTISATGNITGGNLITSGFTLATGNIFGLNLVASANVFGKNFIGNVIATGNISAGNISATRVAGSLTTPAQPNVTSVGILTSLSVTGNINSSNNVAGANLNTAGSVSAAGNITGARLVSNAAGTPTVSSATTLLLSAVAGVQVTGGGAFRMPSMTTTQRNALIASNGDIIYNTTDNKFQGYQAGTWVNLA